MIHSQHGFRYCFTLPRNCEILFFTFSMGRIYSFCIADLKAVNSLFLISKLECKSVNKILFRLPENNMLVFHEKENFLSCVKKIAIKLCSHLMSAFAFFFLFFAIKCKC